MSIDCVQPLSSGRSPHSQLPLLSLSEAESTIGPILHVVQPPHGRDAKPVGFSVPEKLLFQSGFNSHTHRCTSKDSLTTHFTHYVNLHSEHVVFIFFP